MEVQFSRLPERMTMQRLQRLSPAGLQLVSDLVASLESVGSGINPLPN